MPSPAQRQIHESNARFKIVCAGARFGKSMAAGAEVAFHLMFSDFRIWIVSTVYELAEKEFNWAIEFLSRLSINGKKVIQMATLTSAQRGSRTIQFPWGSFAKTKSTEKPQTLLGEELDMIVFGEGSQIARLPWERMLRARIGPRNGSLLNFSTGSGDSGLFADMLAWGYDETKLDWASWQFDTIENPTFSKEEYEKARKELDPKVFDEQYRGKLVSRRGFVFEVFNPRIHVFQDNPTDDFESWPIIRTVYHEKNAYRNPWVCLFIAIRPTQSVIKRDFWVIDEIYQSEVSTTDMVDVVRQKSQGRRILASIGDYRNFDMRQEWKRLIGGITYNNEKKIRQKLAYISRINALQSALKANKIKVHSSCENTIFELQNCKWPEPRKEELQQAEAEFPATKYLNTPMALAQMIVYYKLAQGEKIYEVQRINDNKIIE